MIQNTFSLSSDVIFPLLALAGFGIHGLTLIICWVMLTLPKTRPIGRIVLGRLVSRGWLLLLPATYGMISIRFSDPHSMEPIVGAIWISALILPAWLTRFFLKWPPTFHKRASLPPRV